MNPSDCSCTAYYPRAVRIATWLYLPVSFYLFFPLAGFWFEWWAWATVILGWGALVRFLLSPDRFNVSGQLLRIHRPWRAEIEVDLSTTTIKVAPKSLWNFATDTETFVTSNGFRFLVWTKFLAGGKELRAAITESDSRHRL